MTAKQIIESTPMSFKQKLIIVIGMALFAVDGFDVIAIALAAPGIVESWQIDRVQLGVVLSMELIGMGFGSILLGKLSDTYGRKTTVLVGLVIMGIGMFLCAYANSIVELSVYRLLTGVGIGGVLSTTNAVIAEFSNKKVKAACVILAAGSFPLGIVIGSLISSFILANGSWNHIFLIGTVASIVMLPIVVWYLPESPIFLQNQNSKDNLLQINRILKQLGKLQQVSESEQFAPKNRNYRQLFSPLIIPITICLTLTFLLHIINVYYLLKWLPKIIVDMGFTSAEGATAMMFCNIGMLVGTVAASYLSRIFKPIAVFIFFLLGSAISIWLFGIEHSTLSQIILFATIAGFFVNAAVSCNYGLFALLYPAHINASGTGLSIGIGRSGAILSPILVGFLFYNELQIDIVSYILGCFSLLALVSIIVLHYWQRTAKKTFI